MLDGDATKQDETRTSLGQLAETDSGSMMGALHAIQTAWMMQRNRLLLLRAMAERPMKVPT